MQLADDAGLWVACPLAPPAGPDRAALFLDRDGVVVEEVHFLRHVADVRLTPGVGGAIAAANAAGVPVVLVTNQSGIARGHFGWEAFAAVQDEIVRLLAAEQARIDAVFACGHLSGGAPPYDRADHAWRKPGPGMLVEAAVRLHLDLAASTIVGDRVSDLEAGRAAGLGHGTLVGTGYGAEQRAILADRRAQWLDEGFAADIVDLAADAIHAFLARRPAAVRLSPGA